MNISRQILITAFLSLLGFAFTALIPRDPDSTRFLGYSPARLAMMAAFLSITLVLILAGAVLRRRPQDRARLEQKSRSWLAASQPQTMVLNLAAAAFVYSLAIFSVWLTTSDLQIKGALFRLLPAVLFAGAVSLQVFSLEPLRAGRRQWSLALLFALGYTAAGVLLTSWLLDDIDRWYEKNEILNNLSYAAAFVLALILFTRLQRESGAGRATWLLFLGLSLGLFLLQWVSLPAPYWRAKPLIAYSLSPLLPAIVLAVRSAVMWLERQGQSGPVSPGSLRRWGIALLAAILLALALIYANTAIRHAREMNTGISLSDQSSYIHFAMEARRLNFNYTGDHNRTPGYPFLMALFYRPGMSEEAFFALGKELNIWLSLALLGLLFWIFRRFLNTPLAALLVSILAFSLYIFKAPYFQVEILYYSLAFCAYVLLARLLVRPGLIPAVAAGIVLGLTHLAKAAVLPALLIFSAIFLIKELVRLIQARRASPPARGWIRPALSRLGLLAVVFVLYLAVIFPYIRAVKARFGQYFYNVNTTFYVWYDDYFQALEAEDNYHFTERWPSEIPPDELPGPRKYFREHSPAQILERVRYGIGEQVNNVLSPFSITSYHLSYLLILVTALLAVPRRSWRLARQNPYVLLFGLLYFAGYLASFVWYSPVAPERRFTYSIYLPLLFSIFVALKSLAEDVRSSDTPLQISRLVTASHLLMAATLFYNIYLVVSERMFFDRYGS